MPNTPYVIDFEKKRAIIVGEGKAQVTTTLVQDLAKVVAAAVDYQGEWPVVGGIRGSQITLAKLVELGEEVGGQKFAIEVIDPKDLAAGDLKTTWLPTLSHPSIPSDQLDAFARMVWPELIASVERGDWDTSDEWNQLLPDLKLTDCKTFLRKIWAGKP
jgi:hypothetical protein